MQAEAEPPTLAQADCGDFKRAYNVTDIVVDLAFDFTHPPGSISSAAISAEAAWNICPFPGSPGQSSQAFLEEPPHGLDCYFDEDQPFQKETGTFQALIDDIPNGDWQVVVRGDMFRKVRGAVRFSDDLMDDVVETKQALAGYAVPAARFAELQLLSAVVAELFTPNAVQLVVAFNQQVYRSVRPAPQPETSCLRSSPQPLAQPRSGAPETGESPSFSPPARTFLRICENV